MAPRPRHRGRGTPTQAAEFGSRHQPQASAFHRPEDVDVDFENGYHAEPAPDARKKLAAPGWRMSAHTRSRLSTICLVLFVCAQGLFIAYLVHSILFAKNGAASMIATKLFGLHSNGHINVADLSATDLDIDHDGVITPDELMQVAEYLQVWKHAAYDDVAAVLDQDGDGVVTNAEIEEAIKAHVEDHHAPIAEVIADHDQKLAILKDAADIHAQKKLVEEKLGAGAGPADAVPLPTAPEAPEEPTPEEPTPEKEEAAPETPTPEKAEPETPEPPAPPAERPATPFAPAPPEPERPGGAGAAADEGDAKPAAPEAPEAPEAPTQAEESGAKDEEPPKDAQPEEPPKSIFAPPAPPAGPPPEEEGGAEEKAPPPAQSTFAKPPEPQKPPSAPEGGGDGGDGGENALVTSNKLPREALTQAPMPGALKIRVTAGLGNRLRQVLAAYFYTHEVVKKPLHVVWQKDGFCGAHFLELFEPLGDDVTFALTGAASPAVRGGFSSIVEQYMGRTPDILPPGFTSFMEDNELHFKPNVAWKAVSENMYGLLKPATPLAGAIEAFADAHQLKDHSIAVHVRRTDQERTGGGNVNTVTSTEQFFDWIDQQTKRIVEKGEPEPKIFLATDNPTSRQEFADRYGERVITYGDITESKKIRLTSVEQAVCDAFLAAKALEFRGTKGTKRSSSFSAMIMQFWRGQHPKRKTCTPTALDTACF